MKSGEVRQGREGEGNQCRVCPSAGYRHHEQWEFHPSGELRGPESPPPPLLLGEGAKVFVDACPSLVEDCWVGAGEVLASCRPDWAPQPENPWAKRCWFW